MPRDAGLHSALMGLHSGIIINTTDAKAFVHYQGEELLKDEIRSSMVVVFSPRSVCDLAKDSQACTVKITKFFCKNCEVTKHCSYETFRRTYQWMMDKCKSEVPPSCKTVDSASGSLSTTIMIAAFAVVILVLLAVLSGWFYYSLGDDSLLIDRVNGLV